MRLRDIPVGQLSVENIQALLANRVPESKALEYKSSLPGNSDGDRKEFLADVSAFANTDGGVIVYGIATGRGTDSRDNGLPEAITGVDRTNTDSIQLDFAGRLKDGLAPSFAGIAVQCINVPGQGDVVVLGIAKSRLSPHMVWFGKDGKVHHRGPSGRVQADVHTLRTMYLEAQTWTEEADEFRLQRRVDPVGAAGMGLIDGTATFVHILPLGRLRNFVDLQSSRSALITGPWPPLAQGLNWRFCLNGFIGHTRHDSPIKSYVQWFRFGGVEFFTTGFHQKDTNGELILNGAGIENFAKRTTVDALMVMNEEFQLLAPFIVYLTVNGVLHRRMLGFNGATGQLIVQSPLLLPGIVIDDVSTTEQSLAPLWDMLWQSAGFNSSRG